MTIGSLFAGIGGIDLAFKNAGFIVKWANENNKFACQTYRENHDNLLIEKDIQEIDNLERVDILTAGFPCQAFSISGKREGFNDVRGTLFFDVARIAEYHQPKVIFLENVKNFIKHDSGKTFNAVIKVLLDIGYISFYKVLRSSDFGVPQARERVYIVAFRKDLNIKSFEFPEPIKETKVIKDILETQRLEDSFYINRSDISLYKDENDVSDPRRPLQIGKINKGGQGARIYSINASGITLTAYGGGIASKTGAFFVNGKIRKLTPNECVRLQGFPENFKFPVSDTQILKQLGNSVTINVVEAIAIKIKDTLDATGEKLIDGW